MYLKELIISALNDTIRRIEFHLGANLIVDETTGKSDLETGNNIGKTTVLALVDYCLGGDAEQIYIDPETKKKLNWLRTTWYQEKFLLL
ncbi:hypothetical protein ACFPYJ_32420 [Paenibacillus solisilvae]|uniref:DUF2326 domain-containing protein n=1 Tax=Paenibacillus solisilvae TaxID=2486751 RepID=A0ABW0W7S7_9BACL